MCECAGFGVEGEGSCGGLAGFDGAGEEVEGEEFHGSWDGCGVDMDVGRRRRHGTLSKSRIRRALDLWLVVGRC